MAGATSNAAWVAAYLLLVVGPLAILLVSPLPPPGGFRTDLAIALGFVGAAMLAGQSLLTARQKRLAPRVGLDVVFALHRDLALVALVALVAHPVLLASTRPGGWTLLDPRATPWHVTAGTMALAAVGAIVVTSLFRLPLGLEYDRWRRMHAALAVLALTLTAAHLVGSGTHLQGTGARAVWAGIGGLVLGTTLWVRLVRPWMLTRRPYRVTRIEPERGDAWTLVLEPDGHAGFTFEAGQFVWLTIGHSPFAMREHPFSISSAPDPSGRLDLTVKALGDFTATVGQIQPGTRAWVDGPYGAFTLDEDDAPGLVFIAGGIGLAPLVSMLRALAARRDTRPHVLVVAASAWDRIPLRAALAELGARLALTTVWLLETPSPGVRAEIGRIDPAVLDRHLPADRSARRYFVCGPARMIDATERALHALGIPRSRCRAERFELG